MIVYTIGKTPNDARGILVALNTETGEIVWKNNMSHYAWSSIGVFYTEDNKAYLALGDSTGTIRLMNAMGEELHSINIGSNIEASPVIFGDTMVLGTRGGRVCGIKIS